MSNNTIPFCSKYDGRVVNAKKRATEAAIGLIRYNPRIGLVFKHAGRFSISSIMTLKLKMSSIN